MSRKTIIGLAILLHLVAFASAVSITSIWVSKGSVAPSTPFEVYVDFSGGSCNQYVRFYVDDQAFDWNSMNCAPEGILSGRFDQYDGWGRNNLNYGPHVASAKITSQGVILDSAEVTFYVERPVKILFSPANPISTKPVTITFLEDDTNASLVNMSVRMKYPFQSERVQFTTDESGSITFDKPAAGFYQLTYESDNAHGNMSFVVSPLVPTTTTMTTSTTTTSTASTYTTTTLAGQLASESFRLALSSDVMGSGDYESANYAASFDQSSPEYRIPQVQDGQGGGRRRYCGDGVCSPSESCSSCPRDCGICPTEASSTTIAVAKESPLAIEGQPLRQQGIAEKEQSAEMRPELNSPIDEAGPAETGRGTPPLKEGLEQSLILNGLLPYVIGASSILVIVAFIGILGLYALSHKDKPRKRRGLSGI